MKKIFSFIVIFLFAVFCFSACQSENNNVRVTKPGDLIYQSADVTVTHVEKSDQNFVEYLYAPLSEKKAPSENKIILP